MIERSEQLVALCDVCGLPLETGGKVAHFETECEARKAAINSGWAVSDYDIFCPNCAPDEDIPYYLKIYLLWRG